MVCDEKGNEFITELCFLLLFTIIKPVCVTVLQWKEREEGSKDIYIFRGLSDEEINGMQRE